MEIYNYNTVESWNDGAKLELSINPEIDRIWQAEFNDNYQIREAYGVDFVDLDNGNYLLQGNGSQVKPILIVDYTASPEEQLDPIEDDIDQSEPQRLRESSVEIPQTPSQSLKDAIAAAQDGDTIELENKIYYESDLTIDKDITIKGQAGTIIDGQGTDGNVFTLTGNAMGATIENLTISNANNGIYSDAARNLTLENLHFEDIGLNTNRDGRNNTAIALSHADGLQLRNSTFDNIGRAAVNVGDTDSAEINGLTIQNVNLAAEHAQSHDAAGIKLFNTNKVTISDNRLSGINAFHIWNDTTSNTLIENNKITGVGEDFITPEFNSNVEIGGIYNEKSFKSEVYNNQVDALDGFAAFRATEFTVESMSLGDNDFSSSDLGSTDYWVNEQAEKEIAITEDPDAANFNLFAEEYYNSINIG